MIVGFTATTKDNQTFKGVAQNLDGFLNKIQNNQGVSAKDIVSVMSTNPLKPVAL